MFGFPKKTRMQRMLDLIAVELQHIMLFPRWLNGGQIPETLKRKSYVLGFYYGSCLNLYITRVGDRADLEERGVILLNAIAIALEMDKHDLYTTLMPLVERPDVDFTRGFEHANSAFALMVKGDKNAFSEFNDNIRGTY